LKLRINSDTGKGHPFFKHSTGYGAGHLFFGIDYDEATWLFDPDRYRTKAGLRFREHSITRYVTPKVVAKRVDILIKNYLKPSEYMDERAGLA